MADGETVLRWQVARLLGVKGATWGAGTMLLYPDKIAHVRSLAIRWWPPAGFLALAVPGLFSPQHLVTGAVGAVIGTGVGQIIGGVIARSRAPRRLAAGGDGVTVIPLDSITRIEAGKSARALSTPTIVVTTSDGASYALTARLNKWSADLAATLAERGSRVSGTPQGMAVKRRSAPDGAATS
jgi:hypothetical protein